MTLLPNPSLLSFPPRVIAEGIVDKAADLDVATVMSMGFPATKGGLIFWADLVGAPYIVKRLEQFAEQVGAECVCPAMGVIFGIGMQWPPLSTTPSRSPVLLLIISAACTPHN